MFQVPGLPQGLRPQMCDLPRSGARVIFLCLGPYAGCAAGVLGALGNMNHRQESEAHGQRTGLVLPGELVPLPGPGPRVLCSNSSGGLQSCQEKDAKSQQWLENPGGWLETMPTLGHPQAPLSHLFPSPSCTYLQSICSQLAVWRSCSSGLLAA